MRNQWNQTLVFCHFISQITSKFSLVLLIAVFTSKISNGSEIKMGKIFKDCTVCPEMVKIPSGSFLMGSGKVEQNELPIHKVTIPNPLAVSRFEITFDQWDACHSGGGCSRNIDDRNWGRGTRPVINVLYSDINEYIDWISNKTNQIYRLPTEAEWEYAARAGTTTEYWWGDKMRNGYANCRGYGTKWSGSMSAPVGSFKPNPWGLYDIHGNLFEYVEDCWINDYKSFPDDTLPQIISNCHSRVIKGGAWYYLPRASRSAYRARNDTRIFSYLIGFRVFRELK